MEENKINEVPPSKTGKHVIIDYYRGSMGLLVTEADDEVNAETQVKSTIAKTTQQQQTQPQPVQQVTNQ